MKRIDGVEAKLKVLAQSSFSDKSTIKSIIPHYSLLINYLKGLQVGIIHQHIFCKFITTIHFLRVISEDKSISAWVSEYSYYCKSIKIYNIPIYEHVIFCFSQIVICRFRRKFLVRNTIIIRTTYFDYTHKIFANDRARLSSRFKQ